MSRKYEYINISTPKVRAKPGLSHDLQLLRDLEIANARTVAELGSLPPGGLPVIPPQLAVMPEYGRENFENQEDETMRLNQVKNRGQNTFFKKHSDPCFGKSNGANK